MALDAAMKRRLRHVSKMRELADAEWRDAIREAHAEGISLRKIAVAADISHVRVLQIVRNEPRQSDPAYVRAHFAVSKARGKPKECEVCELNDPERIYDWASLTGNYDDPSDYMRMCRRCHSLFDRERRKNPGVAHTRVLQIVREA